MSVFSAKQKWEWMHSKDGIPKEAFEKSPTLHHCYGGWDGLVIEEGDVEYEYCECEKETDNGTSKS